MTAARRFGAAAIAAALVALVICDLTLRDFRDWWDRHALSGSIVSSLLVLGAAALILDEIVARRSQRERATSVAVQAVILYAQSSRAYRKLTAGDGDPDWNDAREEMRILANMLLTASPNLFDDRVARVFLEEVQRLAGEMMRASLAAAGGSLAPDARSQLDAAMDAVGKSGKPLAARLPDEYRVSVEGAA